MKGWRVQAIGSVLAAALVAAGCAGSPDTEKRAATDAVTAAKAAGAERLAPSEFTAMIAAFRQAEAYMAAKAYREARAGYAAVGRLAERAAKAAEAGKTTARAEAARQLDLIEGRWKALATRGNAGARTLKAEQRAMWNANAKTIADELVAARAAIAQDAPVARDRLTSLRVDLDKIEASLAGVAPPGKKTP